jgi:hypothetical protein
MNQEIHNSLSAIIMDILIYHNEKANQLLITNILSPYQGAKCDVKLTKYDSSHLSFVRIY